MFQSLDAAWDLLRIFEKRMLTKIGKDILKKYYDRKAVLAARGELPAEELKNEPETKLIKQ